MLAEFGGRVRLGLANKPSAISLNQSEMIKPLKTLGSLMSTLNSMQSFPTQCHDITLVSGGRDDAVTDAKGVELESFADAYRHACGLVQQVRRRFSDADEDWWIEISDGLSEIARPYCPNKP